MSQPSLNVLRPFPFWLPVSMISWTGFKELPVGVSPAANWQEEIFSTTAHLAIWVSYFSDAGFTRDMVKRSHRFLLDFIALLMLCCKDLPCSPSELPSDRWHPCLASWWMGCYCHCQKLSLKILVSGTFWQQNSDEYLSYSNPFCFSKTTHDAQTMGQSTCTQLWCFGVTRKW